MILRIALALIVSVSFLGLNREVEAKTVKKKPVKVVEVPDWSARASAELEAAKLEPAVPVAKNGKAKSNAAKLEASDPTAAVESTGLENPRVETMPSVKPTAATITAEVETTRSIIERSSIRFTFLFEPYQPNGTATLGSGQRLTYSELPTSVLGNVDLRWLAFEVGSISGKSIMLGGYAGGGYARSRVPLVAASGFRYDDVALNTFRYEAGLASGLAIADKWNLEARLGLGRNSVVQTSRYSEVVGSFERPYVVGAIDLSYYLASRFAFVASLARRSPIGDGNGSLAFDPLTVSGGFLVQVR